MAFGHPNQQQHMIQGKLKAAQSAKTPRHLKEHLIKQASATKRPPMGATGSVKPTNGGQNLFAVSRSTDGPGTSESNGYTRMKPKVKPLGISKAAKRPATRLFS